MKLVNRLAIAVTPREPYLAWARSIEDGATAVEAMGDRFTTVYLVDEPKEFVPDRLIRKHYAVIFEEQLNAWHRIEAFWPKHRTLAMFREWFDAKIIEMVVDLGQGSIEADE